VGSSKSAFAVTPTGSLPRVLCKGANAIRVVGADVKVAGTLFRAQRRRSAHRVGRSIPEPGQWRAPYECSGPGTALSSTGAAADAGGPSPRPEPMRCMAPPGSGSGSGLYGHVADVVDSVGVRRQWRSCWLPRHSQFVAAPAVIVQLDLMAIIENRVLGSSTAAGGMAPLRGVRLSTTPFDDLGDGDRLLTAWAETSLAGGPHEGATVGAVLPTEGPGVAVVADVTVTARFVPLGGATGAGRWASEQCRRRPEGANVFPHTGQAPSLRHREAERKGVAPLPLVPRPDR
jgi:hypothetical protein